MCGTLSTGVTTLVNVTPAGTQSQSPYGVIGLKLAAGGRHVIFSSLAGDLVADDTNGSQDVFVRDLQTGITTRVSLRADGSQITYAGNGQSDMQLNISADGRFVSFVSSQDLIGDDPSGAYSLYFRSLQTGFLRRVFSSTTTLAAYSVMSDNGEHLAFLYGTFVPGDTRNIVAHYDAEANVLDRGVQHRQHQQRVLRGTGHRHLGQRPLHRLFLAISLHVQWIEFHPGHGDRPEQSRPDHRCEWRLQWIRQWPQHLAKGVG